jgi:hypothetical protein
MTNRFEICPIADIPHVEKVSPLFQAPRRSKSVDGSRSADTWAFCVRLVRRVSSVTVATSSSTVLWQAYHLLIYVGINATSLIAVASDVSIALDNY